MSKVIPIRLCKGITAILLELGKLRPGNVDGRNDSRDEKYSHVPQFSIKFVTSKEFQLFSASKMGCRLKA